MDYKEQIIRLLEQADERTLRLIWQFVRAIIGKK